MKKFLSFLAVALLSIPSFSEVVDSASTGEDTDHGATVITTATAGVVVWTNQVKKAVKLDSILIDAPATATNTVTVTLLRWYDMEYQKKASNVTTNEFSEVVTNRYSQTTNIVASLLSNTVASATVIGDGSLSVNHPTAANMIPAGLYSLPGDVWQITFGTTTNAGVVINLSE